MLSYLLIPIPLAFSFFAVRKGYYPLKAAVTLSCMAIILIHSRLAPFADNAYFQVLIAFAFSVGGDFLLSNRADGGGEKPNWFVYGIGLFFMAHVFYLAYVIAYARFSILPLVLLIASFLVYYLLRLLPRLQDRPMRIAVFLYLVISCFSLALALGYEAPLWNKAFLVAGIGLIVFSDTCIAESNFVGLEFLDFLILPTYYAAHIAITLSLLGAP